MKEMQEEVSAKQACPCVYFCTSKASKAGTGGGGAQREADDADGR
jgi:hypothetical protein